MTSVTVCTYPFKVVGKTARKRINRSEDGARGVAEANEVIDRVMFDCDSDGLTSCGGCEEEQKTCRNDPNIVGFCSQLEVKCRARSPASGPPCYTHWWLTVLQLKQIRRVQVRCILHDNRRQHCGEQRRENADHVNSR